MNGVTITRKDRHITLGSRVGDGFAIALLVAFGFIVFPFFWLLLLVIWLRDNLFPPKGTPNPTAIKWHALDTGSVLLLRYQHLHAATISAAAEGYFEHEPVVRYQADPEVPFFNGYFSEFRVERVDGLFVQKIHFDASLTDVMAMPLYFFCYQTREAEELLDLQGYDLTTKGSPNDFILEAIGEQEELIIHLVRDTSLD